MLSITPGTCIPHPHQLDFSAGSRRRISVRNESQGSEDGVVRCIVRQAVQVPFLHILAFVRKRSFVSSEGLYSGECRWDRIWACLMFLDGCRSIWLRADDVGLIGQR